MIYKRASEIVPRPFDEVIHLFIHHPVDDEEGCVELLEELLTYFQPDEPAPPPSIWSQTVSLLLDNGLLHPSPEIRYTSIEKLGATKSNMVIHPLLRMFEDSDKDVRYCVREVISPPIFNEEQHLGPPWGVIPAWTRPGFELEDVFEPLMLGLQHENWRCRIGSASILALSYKCVAAIPPLLGLLTSDPELWVRYDIASNMGTYSNEDIEENTRLLIISSLNIAKEQLSPIVQWGAVEGLHQFNELTNTEATNLGIELLSFDDAELKEEILRWFQFHGSQEAIQPTHDIIYEGIPPYFNNEVLNRAFETLGELGAINELINLLRATNRPSFNLAAALELRYMEQLLDHEERVEVAERVVELLQANDYRLSIRDQAFLDEIIALD